MDNEKSLRFNEGKSELHYILFYPHFLEAFAKVQSQGAIKYGYANWTAGGKPDAEYYDAAMRHLERHFNGKVFDEDIGTLALAQCIWNLMNLLEQNMKDYPVIDPDFDQEAFVERWKDHPKKIGRPEAVVYEPVSNEGEFAEKEGGWDPYEGMQVIGPQGSRHTLTLDESSPDEFYWLGQRYSDYSKRFRITHDSLMKDYSPVS